MVGNNISGLWVHNFGKALPNREMLSIIELAHVESRPNQWGGGLIVLAGTNVILVGSECLLDTFWWRTSHDRCLIADRGITLSGHAS